MRNLMWLIPSFYGDIRLEKIGQRVTRLRAYDLTALEEVAMAALRTHATSPERAWAQGAAFLPLTNSAYRTGAGVTIELAAPLVEVEGVVAAALKPERELVRVVRFTDGRVVEVEMSKTDDVAQRGVEVGGAQAAVPEVAVTVAAPIRGCPMPNFPEADIRASRVLEAFLTPAQCRDYRSTGAFVTRGADTGRRYMVANRERPGLMAKQMAYRQLFDLDKGVPLCVHDWSVPPAEEMLALLLCLTVPGRETKLLMLPEIDPALAMVDVDPRYRP